MKFENISNACSIPIANKCLRIGLFTDDDIPYYLLSFCNLIDEGYVYCNIDEQMIGELSESNIFNVFLINKELNSINIKLLFDYSNKYGTKIIFAPDNHFDIESQKNLIKNYSLIIVHDYNLKNSLFKLNPNVLFLPQSFEEKYHFIKESHLFNSENYILNYSLNKDENFDPIEHYLSLGIYEKCNPFNNIDLDKFLDLYPNIEKYQLNPFIFYVILNQLFKLFNYYPFPNIFKNPSLSRLVLWDNNNTFVEDINDYFEYKYINDFHFEIIEKEDKLIFKQKNKFYDNINVFSKIELMIKNRKSGKRILKEFHDFQVELSAADLAEIGIDGIYDSYIQLSTLNKYFLFRINYDIQNDKILRDESNYMIFEPYETLDNYLAFRYRWANFVVESINIISKNDDLFIIGEITLFEDLDFEFMELEIFLNQVDVERKFIKCDYNLNGNILKFSGKIDFKYYATDLSQNFKIDVHFKDQEGMKLGSRYLRGYKLDKLKQNLKKYVKKAVFFESFHGKFYSGQPKYIYERMLELGFNEIYDFVWSYYGESEIPGSPLITSRQSGKYKEILGASDYWISNINFPLLKPNENIIYLQTTHGTPYKHMGEDIQSDDESIPKGNLVEESNTWNYLISPNDYSKDIFVRSFKYNGPVINKGYPANDIFYEDTTLKEKELKKKFNINPEKKVILYCPTFRDYDVDESNHRKFSLLVDLNKLFENICDDYVIIMRLHYTLSKNLVISDEMKDSIIDLSSYDDVADLYLISDILISDYSSAFFDFAHSRRPILFFVPDFEKYNSFRGLYDEVTQSLPGPQITSNDELVDCIKNIDGIQKQYKEKYDLFYEKFCDLGHGTASEDIINIVFGDDKNE